MSNSFNISVKPEIAALEAKVDIVDTEVDTIRATDLPTIKTGVDANTSKLNSIINVQLPGVITEIDANETKIDTVDGVVDAIKLKTDLLPQVFRGAQTNVGHSTASETYVDALNITGVSGKILFILATTGAGCNLDMTITIDGNQSNAVSNTDANTTKFIIPAYESTSTLELLFQEAPFILNYEFTTSLRIQYKRTLGAENIGMSAAYNLD